MSGGYVLVRRYAAIVAEWLVPVGVLGGLVWTFVRPARLALIVEPTSFLALHATPAILLAAAVFGLWIGVAGRTWGPVTVSAATGAWRLSGPAGRGSQLWRAFGRAVAVALAVGVIPATIVALLLPAKWLVAVTAVAVAALAGLFGAVVAQRRADRKYGRSSSGWTPTGLHRRSFVSRDAGAQALALAAKLGDMSWIDGVRMVRWQQRWVSVRRVPLPQSPVLVTLRLSVRRCFRHRRDLVMWLSCVLVGIGAATLLDFHYGASVIAALVVYAAGGSLSGGLRFAADSRALRRSLGLFDWQVLAGESVVPIVATIAAAVLVLPWWGVSIPGILILGAAVVAAVLVRSLRGEQLHGGEVVIDSVLTGAAVDPRFIAAQLRGPMVLLVGVAAAAVLG